MLNIYKMRIHKIYKICECMCLESRKTNFAYKIILISRKSRTKSWHYHHNWGALIIPFIMSSEQSLLMMNSIVIWSGMHLSVPLANTENIQWPQYCLNYVIPWVIASHLDESFGTNYKGWFGKLRNISEEW
jgi:hypothetical protein